MAEPQPDEPQARQAPEAPNPEEQVSQLQMDDARLQHGVEAASQRADQAGARARRWRNGAIGAGLVALGSLGGNVYQYMNGQITDKNEQTFRKAYVEYKEAYDKVLSQLKDSQQVQAPVQPQVPTTPVAPQVEYVDKSYKVGKGDNLWNIVLRHYFESKNTSDTVKNIAAYNNLPQDSKLKEGDKVYVPFSHGKIGTQDYTYPVRKGDTLRTYVLRAIAEQVNEVARANNLSVDNRTVTTVGGAERNKSDIVDYLPHGKSNYTHADNALIVGTDGVKDGGKDGYIHPDQKLIIKDYKVEKSAEPQAAPQPATQAPDPSASKDSVSQNDPAKSQYQGQKQTEPSKDGKAKNASMSPLERSVTNAVYRTNRLELPDDPILRKASIEFLKRYSKA